MIHFTEEERSLRSMVARFGTRRIAPLVPQMEETDQFPSDLFREAGELGLLGLYVPEQYGGTALSDVPFMLVSEELACVSLAFAVAVSCHVGVSSLPIIDFGTDEVKRRVLSGLASGLKVGAFALTEPDYGSDAAALRTTARKVADSYVLDGVKTLITNGTEADTFVVMARTGTTAQGARGVSAFLVERDAPGITVGPKMAKMGMKGNSTTQVYFEHCEIPAGNLLGAEGEGFKVAMRALDVGRLSVAAMALGVARRCLAVSLEYAADRKCFSRPLIDHQAIGHRLATLDAQIDHSTVYIYHVARNHGASYIREASAAKLIASELAGRAADAAVQTFGGMGYMKETEAERLYRDARILRIFEGASEIQQRVLLKHLKRRLR